MLNEQFHLTRRVAAVETELNIIREEDHVDSTKLIDDLTKRLAEAEESLSSVREESREFSRRANDTEQYSRRNNIRIKGLKLENGDNCRQSVLLFCQSVLHSSIGLEDIEAAHTVYDLVETRQLIAVTRPLSQPVVLVTNSKIQLLLFVFPVSTFVTT